jgi:hypothetical protein
LLILCAIFLVFTRLDYSALQVDEGGDTFVSTTILKYGLPHHSDGVNETMTFADIYDGLFIYRTWFPYYLQALSILLLGKTTLAARLPFALAGIASVCTIYYLALQLTQRTSIAFLSALFMTFSVPTILYFRTARYMALTILLTILLLQFYLKIYEDKKWRPLPFIITSLLYFHTMYVEFAGAIFGILIHFMIHKKETNSENHINVAICAGVIGILTIPWLAFISPVFGNIASYYTSTSDRVDTSNLKYIKHLAAYLFQSNNYIFPFILLPLLFFRPIKVFRSQVQLLTISIASIVAISTLHSIPMFQYVSAVIPLFFILLAIIVDETFSGTTLKTIMVFILTATNIIHIGPLLPIKTFVSAQKPLLNSTPYLHGVGVTIIREISVLSLPFKYGQELILGYQGPLDKVLEFFKTHGQPGELCYIDNESDSFPYYTGMKLIYKNKLTIKDRPDWIILRGDTISQMSGDTPQSAVTRRLKQILSDNAYEKHVLSSTPSRVNSSYDIQMHAFESPQENGHLFIYHLLKSDMTNPKSINPTTP